MKRLTTRWYRLALPYRDYCRVADKVTLKLVESKMLDNNIARYLVSPSSPSESKEKTHTYCVTVSMSIDADTKWLIKKMFGIGKVDRDLALLWSCHPGFAIRPTLSFSDNPVCEKNILLAWRDFVLKHNKTSRSRGEARHKWKDWFAWHTQGMGLLDPIHITPPNHPCPLRPPI
jgi:hypothetical protein